MSQPALKSIVPYGERKITMEMIQKAVSEEFCLDPGRFKGKTRTKTVSYPRQIAMFLARELTGASLPQIGRAFGGINHTTVLYSVRKIEKIRRSNSDLNKLIEKLVDSFHSREMDSTGERVA